MLGFSKAIKQQAGDTLIEVLFAVTVFSFIVVSSMALMNQGVLASQRSLETTLVRQQMDGQAETLRFLHDSFVEAYQPGAVYKVGSPADQYSQIITHVKTANRTSASSFASTTSCVVPDNTTKDFVLDPVSAKYYDTTVKSDVFSTAKTSAQLIYTGGVFIRSEGIWVEAVRSPDVSGEAGYIDFHIRACWDGPGGGVPMSLGTIVRLYEPRG